MYTRLEPILFLPITLTMRLRLEAAIENLIALLDEIDGDAEIEPAVDDEDGGDEEPDTDDEPSLGALNNLAHQGDWAAAGYSGSDELEDDARDLPA